MQVDFKLDASRIAEMEKRAMSLVGDIQDETKKYFHLKANDVRAISKPEVPVDTGTLVTSFDVYDVEERSDDVVTVRASYGGPVDLINPRHGLPASFYAIKVHENVGFMYRQGKAKFLEDPFLVLERDIAEGLVSMLRSFFV